MLIIPSPSGDERDTGGILYLPEAPDVPFGVVNRTSSRSETQAGKDRRLLEKKTYEAVGIAREMAPGRLRFIVRDIEVGQVQENVRRNGLDRAVATALDRRRPVPMLVAHDMTRFIRSASYSRRNNIDAWPTAAEFAELRRRTKGLILATLVPPWLSEREVHSLVIKRGGKAGRKPKISPKMMEAIMQELGMLFFDRGSRTRWENSIASVAEAFGVSVSNLNAALDRCGPDGKKWRRRGQELAVKKGYAKFGPNGEYMSADPTY